MNATTPTTTAPIQAAGNEPRRQLLAAVTRSALRGRMLASSASLLLMIALVLAVMLGVLVLDAFFVLGEAVRLAAWLLIVAATLSIGSALTRKPWRNPNHALAAAQRIELAAHAAGQPVVCGLSLADAAGGDRLATALRQRAEERAAALATRIPPAEAYPIARYRRPVIALIAIILAWVVLAACVPAQFGALLTRIAAPWIDAPPFALTTLRPTWTPDPVISGSDVLIDVEPRGRQPDRVDFIRLNKDGDEAERFRMQADPSSKTMAYTHALTRVTEPITFKLEAFGRPTRAYTLSPMQLAAPQADTADAAEPDRTDSPGPGDQPNTHRDLTSAQWQEIRQRIEALIAALGEAEARANAIEPSDPQSVADMADLIAALSADAAELAEQVAGLRDALAPDAAASLAELQAALSRMRSGQLPAPATDPAQPSTGTGTPPGEWLGQAGRAARDDQRQIARGLGQADVPSDSGQATGTPDENAPTFNDPQASGRYDEQGVIGDDGPLPPAVMRRVPPRYRPFVNAYFNQIEKNKPDVSP